MFGSTMVTGYPGRSGPPWPGELVIGSTITYEREGRIVKSVLYESVVGEWAYVKELATMSTREGGEWSLLGNTRRGNVVRGRRRRAAIVKERGKM